MNVAATHAKTEERVQMYQMDIPVLVVVGTPEMNVKQVLY